MEILSGEKILSLDQLTSCLLALDFQATKFCRLTWFAQQRSPNDCKNWLLNNRRRLHLQQLGFERTHRFLCLNRNFFVVISHPRGFASRANYGSASLTANHRPGNHADPKYSSVQPLHHPKTNLVHNENMKTRSCALEATVKNSKTLRSSAVIELFVLMQTWKPQNNSLSLNQRRNMVSWVVSRLEPSQIEATVNFANSIRLTLIDDPMSVTQVFNRRPDFEFETQFAVIIRGEIHRSNETSIVTFHSETFNAVDSCRKRILVCQSIWVFLKHRFPQNVQEVSVWNR